MGLLNDFKVWFDCKKSGRTQEYNYYKKVLECAKADILRFEQDIENEKKRIDYLVEHGYSKDSKEYKATKVQLQRAIYYLDEMKLQIQFIRPNTMEDIKYRDEHTGKKYVDELRKVKSPELNLVFHGTPIYFAREILRSGQISSSADRYDGYTNSTDIAGRISVSDIDSLERSLDFFSGMASYQESLPGGCVFAMFPKDDKDFNKEQSSMENVDFRKNPEQLYGIFTTPENIPNVKKWIQELGLNPNLVYDFDGFVHAVKNTSRGLDNSKKMENILDVSDDIKKTIGKLSIETNEKNIRNDKENEIER